MERITRVRAVALLVIFCMILSFFGYRLYTAQVVETGGSKDNTTTYTTMTRVRGVRGDLLDRNGNVLVGNRAANNLVFNNYVILNADDTNEELRKLVNLCDELRIQYIEHFPVTLTRPYEYTLDQYSSDYQSYFKAYLSEMGDLDSDITAPLLMKTLRSSYGLPDDWSDEEVRKVIGLRYELKLRSGNLSPLSNYVFIEDATDEELSAILELNTPGLQVEYTTVREYKTTYAAHILGYVRAMDPSQWEEYEALGYPMDAVVGQEGLEAAFEEYLHGVDGVRVDEVASDGTLIRSYYLDGEEPQAGNSVETTIDLRLQMVAEDSLAKAIRELHNNPTADGSDAEGAAVVVMDVKTGEVLACASYPTYDPETMFDNYDELLEAENEPLYNRALLAEYPPGSTYKMVMAIAGIETGKYSQYSIIEDKGIFTEYEGFDASCLVYSDAGVTHGFIDMRQALMESCNYYFYVLGDNIPIEDSDEIAKQLGLGESTGIELIEAKGTRANRETKWDMYMGSDAEWYAADQILAAIGQSIHRYTPMQLCVYATTLANQGVRYKATFLKRVVSSDYRNLLVENTPQIMNTMELSRESVEAYSTGMYWVTSEPDGTGYKVFGDYPIKVAAKTGTAETGNLTDSDNGAFLCYAPADNPEIAIVVYGEKAGHGSTLGYVARDIMDAYFGFGENSEVIVNENQIG